MLAEFKDLEINQVVNIEAVQEEVAQSVKQITVEMIKALMSGLAEGLDFKGLADKHISTTFKQELSASDEKIQMIYQKLFDATHEHIQQYSMPLTLTFGMMNQQTGNAESADMFLGSFVLPAVNSLIEKLSAEQPEALNNKEIWS